MKEKEGEIDKREGFAKGKVILQKGEERFIKEGVIFKGKRGKRDLRTMKK